MKWSGASVARGIGAAASGILVVLAFPPVAAAELAWIALIPLLLVARFSEPRAAFRWGFGSGMLAWTLMLSWLRGLARFETPWPVVVAGWVSLAAYCALYTGLFAMLVSIAWAPSRRRAGGGGAWQDSGRVVLTALAWVGLEYTRYTLLTGFAWNALGVSQYANLPLIQCAEWGGVYVVSGLVVLMNAGLAAAGTSIVLPYRVPGVSRRRFHPELLVALLAIAVAMGYGLSRVRGLRAATTVAASVPLRCASIQANVSQTEKWNDTFALAVAERFSELTESASVAAPDLTLWPETACPELIDADDAADTLPALLSAVYGPLLAGAIEVCRDGDTVEYANSALLFDATGRVSDVYRKQHLVPFGEYIPLERQIPLLQRFAPLGYSCVPGHTGTVFRLPGKDVAFASLICFEDAIAGLSRRAVRSGARLLVNLTNDGWFEGTSLAVQHMSQCVFRCVENRVPAVRCANLGVSCWIDRTGRLDDETQSRLAAGDALTIRFRVDTIPVPNAAAALTPYTRYGDWLLGIPCAVMSLGSLAMLAWRRRRRASP